MHTSFFTGRQLSAESFNAEQSYLAPHHSLGGRLDAVALNPQPLPPKSMSDEVAASLPASLLDEVALNPQPLPPRSASEQALHLLTNLFDKLGDAMSGVVSNIK